MTSSSYVCSLGTLCHSSALLKRNGLKQVSYPFDWIFSSPALIQHCLTNDFQIFLDKSYYISVDEHQCRHSYYARPEFGSSMTASPLFRHHNPLTKPSDYDYFCRCVARFRKLLTSRKYKLFTIVFVNCSDKPDHQALVELNQTIARYTTNYEIFVLHHTSDFTEPLHTASYDDKIHIIELHTKTASDGIRFTDENDNLYLDNILMTTYAIKMKPSIIERIQKWRNEIYARITKMFANNIKISHQDTQ